MSEITEDAWYETYKPIAAPDGGQITWLHAQTLAYPLEQVWSVVDGDSGALCVIPGYHVVNMVGYAVTEVPWDSWDICAVFDDVDEEDEEDE